MRRKPLPIPSGFPRTIFAPTDLPFTRGCTRSPAALLGGRFCSVNRRDQDDRPYLRRNLSTRPAVSTIFCLPV